jgi:hypothetical protein
VQWRLGAIRKQQNHLREHHLWDDVEPPIPEENVLPAKSYGMHHKPHNYVQHGESTSCYEHSSLLGVVAAVSGHSMLISSIGQSAL